MADLDSLSNEQLRLRLLECGFANLPVTQTTRKVLVKKLKNHLDGQKAKTKRETIHVTKYSSGEEDEVEQSKKTNRRATMAVPSKAPPSPGRGVRRSVDRIAAEEKARRNTSRQTPQKKISIEDEESEEEAQIVRRNDRSRKSESPTLSLSKTVTTTYTNKQTIVEATEEAEEEEEDDDFVVLPRRISPARPGLERNSGPVKRHTFATPSSSSTYEPDSYSSPKFSRPSLSTSYNAYSSPVTNRYGTTAAADSNGTFTMEYESPYLSDFTRRLSKLHAEPLSPNIKPAIPKGTGVYYRTGKNSEVPLNQQNSTLSDDAWEVLRSLAAYKKSVTFFCVFVFIIFFFWKFI